MKSTLFSLSALVAVAAAQDISGLPQCGQICVNNMLSDEKAEELGCENDDLACLCVNPNFTYGVRDCSLAICDQDEVQDIVDRAISFCSGAGVAITTNGGTASATRTATETSDTGSVVTVTGTVSTIYSVFSSDGSAISSPVATTTLLGGAVGGGSGSDDDNSSGAAVTTITSDGSAIVSTISGGAAGVVTTITSDGSAIVSTITSGAGALVTTITSDGSAIVSTITSGAGSIASSVRSQVSSALDDASSAVSSILDDATGTDGQATSTGDADGAALPQKTAAPLGMLAAAGVAAMLL